MIRELNDGDRTGYIDISGVKKGAIHVNGTLQIIGECKYVELDKNNKVLSIRKELPSKPKAETVTKPKAKKATKKES